MDPLLVLTAFIPVITDVFKTVISRFTSNTPKIVSADDYAKVNDADIKKLEILAKLDSAGDTSKWVNNLKSLQRIVVVYLTVGAWIVATFFVNIDPDRYKLISDLAGAIFFFLFGDRVNLYAQRGRK